MLAKPMDVLTTFPVRKTKKQKAAFRDAVQSYVQKLDYPCHIEKGSFGAQNIVIGDPENAKYLVTAHYDTSARMIVPNFISPCNLLVYSLYQVSLIVGLVFASVLLGTIFGVVSKSKDLAIGIALAIYWVLLLLMVIGPANPSNANDNTSGVVTLLEILRTIPETQRHKVCFVLFDLEEAGLLGSSSYRKLHKTATNRQLVLNMDCVGDGNQMVMFPTKILKKDRKKRTSLYKVCGYWGEKSLLVQEKGSYFYPSDQVNFPYGVGIGAFQQGKKIGLYYSKIHTPKDTVLDAKNVNILRAAITTFIACDAAQ